MKGIELAPFKGEFVRIGNANSADSVVGVVKETGCVVKWSRKNFPTPQEAFRAARLIKKSVELYELALGEEHVVPTQVCVGQKKDNGKIKNKVYLCQPFVEGLEGDRLPIEKRSDTDVQSQWSHLYGKLSQLFRLDKEIRIGKDDNPSFPVNITLGGARRSALDRQDVCDLPSTPNFIVEDDTKIIKLFDWGSYSQWSDEMQLSYDKIARMTNPL